MHDSLLGGYSPTLLDTEFSAFVVACHMVGIKVMIDVALRSVGRDSDLIRQHPEWFYWIDLPKLDGFAPPTVNGIKPQSADKNNLAKLYQSENLPEFLSSFSYAPNIVDKEKWDKISGSDNLLEAIEEEFNKTTALAFSDVHLNW